MKKTSVALAVSASLLITHQANAQPDDIEETLVIGEYLQSSQLNALKSPTPVIDVPQSLSIITAEQITQQGFNSIGDIVAYTPGVNTSQGEGHRDAVVFRGVRSTADYYIDGVRDDVQYYRPLYNLEQVEILRGPNALLFGRGGTGGILNRVTKKAALGEEFTGYQLSADTFGQIGVQLDSNFSTGDNSAVRFNMMYEGAENHRDFYDGDQIALNPTARIELSADTTLDLSYEYVDYDRFIDRGVPTGANGEPVEAFEDIVFGDPELNKSELEANLFRASLEHQFSSDMKGRVSAFYGDYDKLYQNFYASSYEPTVDATRVGIDGYLDTTQRENFILSGDLIWEFAAGGVGHTVVTGIEYIDTTSNNDRYNPVWTGSNDDVEFFSVERPLNFSNGSGVNADGIATSMTFSDFNDDDHAKVETLSFYIQDEIEINDNFDVVIGARFDSFDIDVDVFDENGDLVEQQSNKDEEVSPRLGLVYKPQENISIYGSYSESFLPKSGEQFANIDDAEDRLDADTFTNLEAGLKWDFAQGLSLTFAVFEIEESATDISDIDSSLLEVVDTTTDGFEIQLTGQVTDKWYLSAGYSNLDGEIIEQSGATGLTPRELPENMFSIWNTYQMTEKFGLGIGMTYQDESFIDNDNTATLPSYTRFDAAAYYDLSEDLRIQLNIENLTDELYFPNAHSTHQATVGVPLSAMLTVSGKF